MKPTLYSETLAMLRADCKRDNFEWPSKTRCAAATPFVVDPETVDEAVMSLPFLNDVPLLQRAVVPYPRTWVEFEVPFELMTKRRPVTHIGFLLDDTDEGEAVNIWKQPKGTVTADVFLRRKGYLEPTTFSLWWHPTLLTEIMAQLYDPAEKGRSRMGQGTHYQAGKLTGNNVAYFHGMIFGLREPPPWMHQIGGVITGFAKGPSSKDGLFQGIQVAINEIPPTLCGLIVPILAMMANCRQSQRRVEPLGYWLDRKHRPQAHTVHTVVRVDTSPRPIRERLEDGDGMGIQRREHDVRTHNRRIRRGQPDEYVVTVRAHRRGNALLGQVIHDHYIASNVTRH